MDVTSPWPLQSIIPPITLIKKDFTPIILQGVVDANDCFLDICIGWPGGVHDVRVFVYSPLYQKITEEELLPDKNIAINGVDIPLPTFFRRG